MVEESVRLQGLLKNIEKLIKSIKAWIDASKNVVVLFTLEGKAVHENVSVGVVVTEVDMEAVADTEVEEETMKENVADKDTEVEKLAEKEAKVSVSDWINVIEVSIANARVEAHRIWNAETEEKTRRGDMSHWKLNITSTREGNPPNFYHKWAYNNRRRRK